MNIRTELVVYGDRVEFTGMRGAVKVVRPRCAGVQEFGELALHKNDLEIAIECLNRSGQIDDLFLRHALWCSAVVHYGKCLKSMTSRGFLRSVDVFASEPGLLASHETFIALRDKHFAHDDNKFLDVAPCAFLAADGEPRKVVHVGCGVARRLTAPDDHMDSAKSTVEHVLTFVSERIEALRTAIAQRLEDMSYEEISSWDAPQVQIAEFDAVSLNRGRLSE